MIFKQFLVSGLVFLSVSIVKAQEGLDWIEHLKPKVVLNDSSFRYSVGESMQRNKVNSFSVAAFEGDNTIDSRCFQATNNSILNLPENTHYQAGSISKSVAAIGVMRLVDQFDLDLDTSINVYLKSWKIESNSFDASEITIRNLLSHTSGINVHGFPGYKSIKKTPEIIDILNGKGNTERIELMAPADSVWSYSGGGYEVLHLLIEELSGMDFADYLNQEVLVPIGMTSSTYKLLDPSECSTCAHAVDEKGEEYKSLWFQYPESAAAGLWTTSSDLAKLLIHLQSIYNGKSGILSKEVFMEMITPVQNNYGLGFFVEERNDGLYIGHNGKNYGFTNDMMINLKTGCGLVIMSDSDNAFPVMEELKANCPNDPHWYGREQIVIISQELTEAQLMVFVGMYTFTARNGKNYKAEVKIVDNALICIDKSMRITHTLIPTDTTKFRTKENGVPVEFIKDGELDVMVWGERKLHFIK